MLELIGIITISLIAIVALIVTVIYYKIETLNLEE